MGRLIDADKLIDFIRDDDNPCMLQTALLNIINAQHTAYDVNAVVKQLDRASDYYEFDEQGREHVQMVDFEEAIEIVKAGGIDEVD